MKPNIFFWHASRDGKDGCYFYRMYLPARTLVKYNDIEIHLDTKPQLDVEYSLVVAQRVSRPVPTKGFEEIDIPKVIELDDDLLSVPSQNPAYWYYKNPEVKENLIRTLKAADVVSVTTNELAETFSKYNENIWVLPNCMPQEAFDVQDKEHKGIRIGWSGGTSHRKDAERLKYPLSRILKQNKDVEFHTVGWDMGKHLKLESTHTEWLDMPEPYYSSLQFDIGVCPLIEDEFNRGKSALKALEYAARGIPVIVSDCVPYNRFCEPEWSILCRTDQDWLKAFRELLSDSDRRLEMGAAAKEFAKNYHIDNQIHLWKDAYGI